MNPDNFDKATRAMDNYKRVQNAIKDITTLLASNRPDTDGSGDMIRRPLYSFTICEHKDGSGFNFNLTGCGIINPLLTVIRDNLIRRTEEMKVEISQL